MDTLPIFFLLTIFLLLFKTDEIIDEDIEALLYAQVYYGKSTEDDDDTGSTVAIEGPSNIDQDTNLNVNKSQKEKDQPDNLESTPDSKQHSNPQHLSAGPQYLQISTSTDVTNTSDSNSTQIIAQIPISPVAQKDNQQLLNHITINQFFCPKESFFSRLQDLRAKISWSNQCEQALKDIQEGRINEKEFFKLLRRKRFQEEEFKKRLEDFKSKYSWTDKCEEVLKDFQEERLSFKQVFRRLRMVKKLEDIENKERVLEEEKGITDEIISLSDTNDNSDIEIVETVSVETKPMKPKVKEFTEITDISDENDDVIYVEPPPVPIISVEDDEDIDEIEGSAETKEPLFQNDEEASNDFLPTATTVNATENFNFSLHDSEFQVAEFVRPANPTTDHYETESSTSTSDFNRDSSREFSNTVKTVVFNEVDFPKDDIFDESNNLEKFGEFITPKRKDKVGHSADGQEKTDKNRCKKRTKPRTSSESSSESDYDASDTHQNLPHLSPMVAVGLSPKKVELQKGKNNKNRPSREDQGVISEEETSSEKKLKKAKKKKKKNTGDKTIENLETVAAKSEDFRAETTSQTSKKAQSRASKLKKEFQEIAQKALLKKAKIKKRREQREWDALIADCVAIQEDAKRFVDLESTGRLRKRSGQKTSEVSEETETNDLLKMRKTCNKNNQNITTEDVNKNANEGTNHEIDLIISEEEQNELSIAGEENTDKGSNSQKITDISEKTSHVAAEENKKRKSGKYVTDDTGKVNNEEPERNKKKKGNTSKKGSSIEDRDENRVDKGRKTVKENLNISKEKEDNAEEEEEDVMIIEQKIPLHVIESSDSDDDIISFEDLGQEFQLELANVDNDNNKLEKLGDEFDIKKITSKMSDDPDKWQINNGDRYNLRNSGGGPRCRKCRQWGHIAIRCPNKPGLPRCALCGFEGHEEPRCTKKVCFTCATKGNFSTVYCYKCANQRKITCTLCNLQGHSKNDCPDLWRRYYLTTTRGPLVLPKNKNDLKPKSQRWCSGCAGKGHFEFQCRSYKWIREYPASSLRIFNYHDVYNSKIDKITDLRQKLNITRSLNDNTNQESVESAANASQTEDNVNNEANTQFQIPLTSTETFKENPQCLEIRKPEKLQPAEVPPLENFQPTEVSQSGKPQAAESPQLENLPQASEIPQPEKPISHSSTETINPQKELYSPCNLQDFQRSKRKAKRGRQKQKLNPVSLMNTRYTPYQSVINPYLMVNNMPRPWLNSNQIGPMTGLFNQVPGNIVANQLAGMLNNYQPLPNQMDFTQIDLTARQWNNNEMPEMARHNYEPVLDYRDFSNHIPNNQHLPFENSNNRNPLDLPFTITREPSPRLCDNYRRQQPNNISFVPIDNQPIDEFTFQRPPNISNISVNNQPIRSLLDQPLDGFIALNAPKDEHKDYRAFKRNNVENATAKKFSTLSIEELCNFLKSELEKLENMKNPDPKLYKKKLNSIDHLKKIEFKTNAIKKQIYFQFKQINMYLFGIKKLENSKWNLDFLRNFVFQPGNRLNADKRIQLLEAYGYIFGGEHPGFNYRKHLNILSAASSSSQGHRRRR